MYAYGLGMHYEAYELFDKCFCQFLGHVFYLTEVIYNALCYVDVSVWLLWVLALKYWKLLSSDYLKCELHGYNYSDEHYLNRTSKNNNYFLPLDAAICAFLITFL